MCKSSVFVGFIQQTRVFIIYCVDCSWDGT